MTLWLSVTIKIALLTLAALAATTLLRRRSAAVRHWVLATTVFACVCIPPMELLLPEWPIPLPDGWSGSTVTSSITLGGDSAASPAVARPSDTVASAAVSSAPRLATVLASVWFVGAVAGLGVLVAGLFRLRRLARCSTPVSRGPWRDIADDVVASLRYPPARPAPLLPPPDAARHVGTGTTDDSAARGSAGLGRGSRACRLASRVGPCRTRRLGDHR